MLYNKYSQGQKRQAGHLDEEESDEEPYGAEEEEDDPPVTASQKSRNRSRPTQKKRK